ncbi:MAG: NAD-dependent epimerase/dehydratase family protein [Pelagibacteraceae bacterium]|nr:NAD-dependent epimerase/dehydratase family protein [Pelagibacteraceae bacterium]MCI5078818.1 NAD-dependent epimerase/dehydratase family protein [Pelagibacteraceae bacterium]
MKKIIVFGGSGFIGKNLINYFSKRGFRILATYTNAKPKINFKNTKWIKLNLIKKQNLKSICQNASYAFICSAITSGAKNIVSRPEIFVSDNAIINSNIISEIYKYKIKQIFFFSCSVMYPHSNKPKKEHEFNLEKCYPKYYGGAAMKIFTENLCKFYSSISTSKFTVLRHTNTYGPFDKFNKKEGHFFCSTISKVLKAKDKIVMWGSGKEKRNFIHIDDVINAINILIKRQKKNFEIVNVGVNKSESINHIVNKIIKISKRKLKVEKDLKAPNLNIDIHVNSSKLKSYGWSPKISIDQGIKKTIDWYKKNYY